MSTKHRIKTKTKKRATFTYYNPKIRKLTNLLKHTNINIAFKNRNTIQQYTKPKILNKNQDYNMSGIYRLTCNTSKMSYIGQTSRNINQRYGEPMRYIRSNGPQSAYAQHILQNLHEYGSIADTVSLLKSIHRTNWQKSKSEMPGTYVTSGTMAPNLPTHSIYYKIYTNTDLLQTLCPYSNPYIRRQC